MSANTLVATLLAMAGQRNIITVPRAFVRFTGSLESAMMLNQLLYWKPRAHGEAIYKTDLDWADELCLTRYAVRKARECLAAMGFLTFATHHVSGAPAVHYTIDFDVLVDRWTSWLQGQEVKCENELYEPPSKVRKRTLPDGVKFENELSKVRKRTNMKEQRLHAEITVGVGDRAREDLFRELRKRTIGRDKATAICATPATPADILTSIDNLYDPSNPQTMGGVINLLIDAPPPEGHPYERPDRSVQSGHAPDRPQRPTGRPRGSHNPTGGAELRDPGWMDREIAAAEARARSEL